jgi:hypothetical protein
VDWGSFRVQFHSEVFNVPPQMLSSAAGTSCVGSLHVKDGWPLGGPQSIFKSRSLPLAPWPDVIEGPAKTRLKERSN